MTGALYSLGGFAAKRALWVFGAWLVLAVAFVILANAAGKPTAVVSVEAHETTP